MLSLGNEVLVLNWRNLCGCDCFLGALVLLLGGDVGDLIIFSSSSLWLVPSFLLFLLVAFLFALILDVCLVLVLAGFFFALWPLVVL